jgi:putative flippase GtrA
VSANAWRREGEPLARDKSHDSKSGGASILLRWLKFNLVGAIGIAVQLATLFLLKSGLHFHYLAATAIAVETAVLHNFVWHEQFTWADRTRANKIRSGVTEGRERFLSLRRLLRFHLANGAVSIVGNLLLMKLLVDTGRMNYLLANGIAIVLCSVANFVLSDAWVFGPD